MYEDTGEYVAGEFLAFEKSLKIRQQYSIKKKHHILMYSNIYFCQVTTDILKSLFFDWSTIKVILFFFADDRFNVI